jgi:hypothetical protein
MEQKPTTCAACSALFTPYLKLSMFTSLDLETNVAVANLLTEGRLIGLSQPRLDSLSL